MNIILKSIMLALPVVFLVASVIMATKSVQRGKKPRTVMLSQIGSFLLVGVISFAMPLVTSAATAEAAAPANGLGLLAAALAVGIAGIGGGIAVGPSAAAAIGATSEDPKNFGKAIIFVALGEGIALYGLLIAILILMTKV
ncbi:ATP synthase subunit C [Scatolibacter rhodanostii]|uniref:ATP synthase subunit C n=1 Tax=Scatolibacter rhodanostii TaxID=2014781 RepID=UPI000C0808BC|nr:ATP synthase subunit C [Scatolibacter rhodanostii]